MHSVKRIFLAGTLILLTAFVIFANPSLTLNRPNAEESGVIEDDAVPDVTARVARISFILGNVKIRRLNNQDWESATLNLPVVEGDEINTAAGARVEIQFNSYNHLRLAENSYLKILKLKDEGIALSLPEGTLSLRLNQFEKDKSYLEIDAPSTTLAVQKGGVYRIDAGHKGDAEVRVGASDGGEARIYSDNSGFTLKNGRSTRIFISGNNSGEWATGDVSKYADDFDTWALERDSLIAKNLQNAHYDTYYDRDIYGAEDLADYGEWVHTRKYGYVWRPYRAAISSYANWSPYRYGNWRWVSPYGWTWVNDEPWGWATYHHGRWFYDNGYWSWTPYGQHRSSRSWWSPALVVVAIYDSNVCWYPLPYSYAYYNYNHSNRRGGGNGGHGGGPTPIPTPNPRPSPTPVGRIDVSRLDRREPPVGEVPPEGVVMTPRDQFGRGRREYQIPAADLSKRILLLTPEDDLATPVLPSYKDLRGRIDETIRVERPREENSHNTGAMTRKTDAPLDDELRKARFLGGREPVKSDETPDKDSPRPIGAVDRPLRRMPPPESVTPDQRYSPPQPTGDDPPNSEQPPKQDRPQYVPPPRREPPQREPPEKIDPPKYDPPPRREPPQKIDPPRYEPPPAREPPHREPPQRIDPPKSEPKPENKPVPPHDRKDDGKKDGRRK